MNFEIVSAYEILLSDQAKIFNAAFTGYLAGWNELEAAGLARFICTQGADLYYSRFIVAEGKPVGFGYINRTGTVSRLAAMGTASWARRTGAAAHLLSKLLEEAKTRGDQAMVLEVFEQNSPALELYRRFGFGETTRLFGWRLTDTSALEDQSTLIQEIPVIEASQMPHIFDYPNLPWQISRHAVLKVPAAHAFRSDNTCIVIGDPTVRPIRVHGIFQRIENWPAARAVLSAVARGFPNHEFHAPAIFPEPFGSEIFAPLGFVRESLNQLLMRRQL